MRTTLLVNRLTHGDFKLLRVPTEAAKQRRSGPALYNALFAAEKPQPSRAGPLRVLGSSL